MAVSKNSKTGRGTTTMKDKEPDWMYEKPIDDFYRSVVVNISDQREKILTDRIKLVVKQQPWFIPRKLWLKLASIFLQINHEKYISDNLGGDK